VLTKVGPVAGDSSGDEMFHHRRLAGPSGADKDDVADLLGGLGFGRDI